jgi:hypothetical protein
MDTNVPSPKNKPPFHPVILPFRIVASWRAGIVSWWSRFTYGRTLEKVEHLNAHMLRDIGRWRGPESRTNEWWKIDPPP